MQACSSDLVARTALTHCPIPLETFQPHQVGMMYDCSPGELLTRSGFMHHDDNDHITALCSPYRVKKFSSENSTDLCTAAALVLRPVECIEEGGQEADSRHEGQPMYRTLQ